MSTGARAPDPARDDGAQGTPPASRHPADPTLPNFRTLFEATPALCLALTTDFIVVAASDEYLIATRTSRDKIVGRDLLEICTEQLVEPIRIGAAELRDSLARVLAHRRPDVMAVQKYADEPADSQLGELEVRLWRPVNSPVFGSTGEIVYLVHRLDDVTELAQWKLRATQQEAFADELKASTARMEAQLYKRLQELKDAHRRLRDLQSGVDQRVQQRTAELESVIRRLRSGTSASKGAP